MNRAKQINQKCDKLLNELNVQIRGLDDDPEFGHSDEFTQFLDTLRFTILRYITEMKKDGRLGK